MIIIKLNPRQNVGMVLIRSYVYHWFWWFYLYWFDYFYCLLYSTCWSASSRQNYVLIFRCAKTLKKTIMRVMHHLSGIFSKMAEFSMRVGCKFFCIFNHFFNSSIRPVCSCMVNIDSLQLNVKWWSVSSVKSYNIFPNFLNLTFLFLDLLAVFNCRFA